MGIAKSRSARVVKRLNPKLAASETPLPELEPRPFPPRWDYASLSVRDLLDAREAYHVHLSNLENVVATAIGRYRIHERDWYATHAPDQRREDGFPKVTEPRTLSNSIVRPWSWPAVLVFVKTWQDKEALGSQAVPRTLYLPDGRVVPTCVILATPDEELPPPVPGPAQVSSLLGGGYSCLREHQGIQSLGTLGCLVQRDGSYFALTNRHVAGGQAEPVQAYFQGQYRRVGASSDLGVSHSLMSAVFEGWPFDHTYLRLDAGLVRVDDVSDWTAQAFGIGEVGLPFDATSQSITLDLIGCPVRAFGGTSGVMEGEIQALFFRYESLGGFDYATDVLIGPRTGAKKGLPPLTRPGDSGTLWFYDPSNKRASAHGHEDLEVAPTADRGARARRLRPVAMQWGGQRVRLPNGETSAFALASFLSTVCSKLGVELVRDWSTGHDEYWGKVGHFSIGWKACNYATGALGTLLHNNQVRIGFDDKTVSQGEAFRVGREGFVPLADVPDYVWINSRPATEGVQHFADIDIYDIAGKPSLLERCFKDSANLSAKVWQEFFDGFKAEGVGPEEGVLPFRVWQLWQLMVESLRKGDVKRFVATGGVMAHYVGDASQPLHCSWLHHGQPPTSKVHGRKYPVPRDSPAFAAFKKTRAAQIHGIYEETMLEVDTASALAAVDAKIGKWHATGRKIKSGHDAAIEIIRLMHDSQARLSPEDIIAADDPTLTAKQRAAALWANKKVRTATIQSLADSTRLLADLWTSAWLAGNGAKVPKSKLVQFSEKDLEAVYRDSKFAPSLSLAAMVKSKDFEP